MHFLDAVVPKVFTHGHQGVQATSHAVRQDLLFGHPSFAKAHWDPLPKHGDPPSLRPQVDDAQVEGVSAAINHGNASQRVHCEEPLG